MAVRFCRTRAVAAAPRWLHESVQQRRHWEGAIGSTGEGATRRGQGHLKCGGSGRSAVVRVRSYAYEDSQLDNRSDLSSHLSTVSPSHAQHERRQAGQQSKARSKQSRQSRIVVGAAQQRRRAAAALLGLVRLPASRPRASGSETLRKSRLASSPFPVGARTPFSDVPRCVL